jgi:hypothetical protein
MSLALHDVGAVHSGSRDFDQDFSRPGRRSWNFGYAHRSCIARALDHDRPHALFSNIHIVSLKHFLEGVERPAVVTTDSIGNNACRGVHSCSNLSHWNAGEMD